MQQDVLTRRALVAGIAAAGGLVLIPARILAAPAAKARKLTATDLKLTTHRGPGCSCCLKWAERGRQAGFTVDVVDDRDIFAFKEKLGIPQSLYSCHTSLAGPYVVEGHVPFDAIKKLLTERPDVKGIGLPGMPAGSPGMEAHGHDGHDGHQAEPLTVYAFNADGKVVFFD